MSELFDYLFDIEAAPDEERVADGLCCAFLNVRGTGTCGVTTPGDIPCEGVIPGEEDQDGFVPSAGGCRGIVIPCVEAAGTGHTADAVLMVLPPLLVLASQAGWLPGAGSMDMPRLEAASCGRTLVLSRSALPPLFALARTGCPAQASLPACMASGGTGSYGDAALPGVWTLLAASGLTRQGNALAALPVLIAEGYSCGLDNPVVRRTAQASVVGLLNRDSPVLAALAAALVRDLDDPDDRAAALLYAVSNLLLYVPDPESMDYSDVWSCGLATWFRGQGDCEDGAILLHGLLLACGADDSRLATIFGRVGPDNLGHAWTCYKRSSDERWTILDWTTGPRSLFAGPEDFPTLTQSPDYHSVEYALTGTLFRQARMSMGEFFPSVRADALSIPPAACDGVARMAARGEARLGAGPGGPAACLGRAGAVGAAACPSFAIRAGAGWRTGRAALPGARCQGETGSLLSSGLPLICLAAACAARTLGRCTVTACAALGYGACPALSVGPCRLAGPGLRATGHAGSICRAAALLPGPGGRLTGSAGLSGDGPLVLPLPVQAGLVWFDVLAAGGLNVGPLRLRGRGAAGMAAGETRGLGYDDGEAWR
jgi:hypothetical protein